MNKNTTTNGVPYGYDTTFKPFNSQGIIYTINTDEGDEIFNNDSFEAKFNRSIDDITSELAIVLKNKNHDYNYSFDTQWDDRVKRGKNPLDMIDMRITDKYRRLIGIIDGNETKVKDESLKDTLLDMAGYAILAYRKLNETTENNKEQ